jgi:hypothetical protein
MVSILPSVLRTLVPLAVGYFLAWPVTRALGLTEEQITSLITVVVSAIYYLIVRLAEQYVPRLGWLLGYPSAPKYLAMNHLPAKREDYDRGAGELTMILIAAAVCIVIVALAKVLDLI